MAQEILAATEDLDETADLVDKLRTRVFADVREEKIDLDDLVGIWGNCDPDTRGIVRIELSSEANALKVQVFGACHPSPCDWGEIDGRAYAETVVDNQAVAFTARYDPGFADTIVTGHLHAGALLVDVFTRFKDASGRSNYYDRYYLCRREG